MNAMGMKALPAGVSRSEIPGVYVARGKNGSNMYSQNPSDFANSPVDTAYTAPMPGASRGLHTNREFANNSLGMNPSDMIATAGDHPESALLAQQMMVAGINDDKANANQPEVQLSNRGALAQLRGNTHDVNKRYYGAQDPLDGLGGAGLSRAGTAGGLTPKDVLGLHIKQASLAQGATRDAATAAYRAEQGRHTDAAQDQDKAQYFMTQYNNAEARQRGAGAALLAQVVPKGLGSVKSYADWLATPEGNAWSTSALTTMNQGAKKSLWPSEWGDAAQLGANVNWSNMKRDSKTGKFRGFMDSDGDVEYPRNDILGHANYNEQFLKQIDPKLLSALQARAVHNMSNQ